MGSNSSLQNGLLYTTELSDEKLIVCFSVFLRTDAKVSVLKVGDEEKVRRTTITIIIITTTTTTTITEGRQCFI